MNKFYTRRNANILNIAGWVFTIAAWLLPRPWDSIAAVLGVLAFGLAIHIRSYLDGYERGHAKGHEEVYELWDKALEVSKAASTWGWLPKDEIFKAKTFRTIGHPDRNNLVPNPALEKELHDYIAADKDAAQ